MECPNQTQPAVFIISGFSFPKELKVPLLLYFFLMYILTLCGNSLIVWVVASEVQLHKPMYWFLCHLSFLDMAYPSIVVPRLIAGFFPSGKIISFGECVCQVFFFHFLGCAECLLYTIMAYDRFIAICKPLHYSHIMHWSVCLNLCLGAMIGGCMHSVLETTLTFRLPYGWNNQIDYVFCDIPALLKLTCADTILNEMVTMVDIGLVAMGCFILILTSYVYIVSTILRINSSEGRRRAFSTCSAHITVVVIYYVPIVFHYLRPASQDSVDGVVSMFYTTITPFLNPVIYTFRNKEMKAGLSKLQNDGSLFNASEVIRRNKLKKTGQPNPGLLNFPLQLVIGGVYAPCVGAPGDSPVASAHGRVWLG
ncbi:olfactory receptor 10G6-like [Heteronotia binoei]|uniref:olfactory receptor 10G6-like n=1 Tax=Heteronotia binoei TaxID=13085 RepID=UPI00292CFEA9|nr:olfactory receptor 10G6-like [Heteronotia binoei]